MGRGRALQRHRPRVPETGVGLTRAAAPAGDRAGTEDGKLREIIEKVASGALSPEDALRELRLFAVQELEGLANLDTTRELRKGLPEIVRCRGKPAASAVALGTALYDVSGRAIFSSATDAHRELFARERPDSTIALDEQAGVMVAKSPTYTPPRAVGVAGIVTGGTSDIPVARQAQIILEETGCAVHTFWDVGIAGLHRLFPVVRELIRLECDVVIAVAGQEAALAPVLAGLVDLPVIGLPTSTGTGHGGEGVSALMTMLQACSMGIATVNIDNGIAAGAVASAIARRVRRVVP